MRRLLEWFPVENVLRVARLRPFDTSTAEGRSLERYRRIVLSTAASVAGRAVTTLASLALVPIAIGVLGKERYGLWAAINALVPWVILFDLGLVAGLVNPLSEAHGRDDRRAARSYFATAFVALLGIAGLLGVVCALLLPHVPAGLLPIPSGLTASQVRWSVGVALGVMLLSLPLNAVPQLYAAYQRSYVSTTFSTLGALAALGLFLLAVHERAPLPALIGAANSTAVIGGLAALVYAWGRDMPWLRPSRDAVHVAALRRLRATSVPLYAFQIGALLVNQSQQLILARRADLSTVAEYDLILKVYAMTTLLITTTTASFAPSFREAYERGEAAWMRRSFWHLARVRMLLAVGACVVMVPAGNLVLRVWLHRTDFQYDLGAWLTLCAYVLIATWASSFGELLTVLDRIWPQVTVVLVQGVLTVGLTWALGPRGVHGALLAVTVPAALLSGWFLPRLARPLLSPQDGGAARDPSSAARR